MLIYLVYVLMPQVASPPIQHIIDWPLYPEPFYHASGTELRPQPVGDETGRLVYHYSPTSAVNYVSDIKRCNIVAY